MGYDEVFVPFAVAAITPLGCAWVASRFVPPTNKWIYGSVVIGTAFLSWKYIVPRMLNSMGYPVPFEAETEYCEECSYREHDACPMIEGCPCCDETIDALEYQAEEFRADEYDYEMHMKEPKAYKMKWGFWIDNIWGEEHETEEEAIALWNDEVGQGGFQIDKTPYQRMLDVGLKPERVSYGADVKGEKTKCPKCKQMTIADDSEGYEVCSDSDCGWFEEGLDARHDKDLKMAEGGSGKVYALKKALKAYKGTLEDCLDGRYGTDDAERVMDELENINEQIVRMFNAESKFIRPYDGKHGIKLERDNKGRYRRKLSIPLKKK